MSGHGSDEPPEDDEPHESDDVSSPAASDDEPHESDDVSSPAASDDDRRDEPTTPDRGDDPARRSDDSSSRSDDSTGQTDDFTGQTDDFTGQTDDPAGRSDRSSMEAGPSSGRLGSSSGRSGRESGPAGGASRRTGSASSGNDVTIEDDGVVRWLWKTDNGTVVAFRDILSSVAIVAVIGLLLFGISGIWPPLVAVESPSMEPNMHTGDLIFVVDEERFVGDGPVDGTGVVTMFDGEESGHDKFGKPGDVVIFMPDGNEFQTPVIHRAHFWVEEGDDWVAEANPDYVRGQSCDQIQNCPAEHDGFITKGDNNQAYDQLENSGATTDVVKPDWVTGKAMYRIPWLGHIRLTFDQLLVTGAVGVAGVSAAGLAVAGRRRSGRL